jgi:hypothetical protein
LVQNSISKHQNSSPTNFFEATEQMARGFESIAHLVTLLQKENHDLRAANEALSKRRRAKKTRIRKAGALFVEDAKNILAQKEAEALAARDKRANGHGHGEGSGTSRRCGGNRGETGHNIRTCRVDANLSEESISEESE